MAIQQTTPFICHLFVCTNDRQDKRKSCADGGSKDIRSALKKAVNDNGWKSKVRVSQCGCLGVCGSGPNVMIYPQKIWFSEVTLNSIDEILDEVTTIVNI